MNSFSRSGNSYPLKALKPPEHRLIVEIQRLFAREGALHQEALWADALPLAGKRLVTSVDTGIAGIHFPYPFRDPSTARGSGYRVLAASCSDLAAQGARPLAFLLSLTLPSRSDPLWILEFLKGMARASRALTLPLLGGNLSKGKELAVHCTVFGTLTAPYRPRGKVEPGDDLWVTGTQGDAALGLILYKQGRSPRSPYTAPYFFPSLRLEEGVTLHEQPWLKGCVDISDGWLRDLYNLVHPSGYGLRVDPKAVPRSPFFRQQFARIADPLQRAQLYWGGDDYELAFATRKGARTRVERFLKLQKIPATRVGEVLATPCLEFTSTPECPLPKGLGYDTIISLG